MKRCSKCQPPKEPTTTPADAKDATNYTKQRVNMARYA